MRIGFIIPFFEGQEYFDQLLSSLEESIAVCGEKLGVSEILVVDNSTTALQGFFEKYTGRVVYKKTGVKLGYGKACNVGYAYFKEKGFDYIQVINQDGYFEKNNIATLISAVESDEHIMYASAMPLTMADHSVESFFIKYYLCLVPEYITDLVAGSTKPYYPAEKMPGVCFMFRLEGYEQPYLFDPKIYMYFEDEDLCRRINEAGKKVVLVPGALFYHQHSHTTSPDQGVIMNQNKLSENYLRIKYARGKAGAAYGLVVDEFAETCKMIFRGRFGAAATNLKMVVRSILLNFKKS